MTQPTGRMRRVLGSLVAAAVTLTACAQPTPEVIEIERIVEKQVVVTREVQVERVVEKEVEVTRVVEVQAEPPEGPKPTIRIQDATWESAQILAEIAAFITEQGLGYRFEMVGASTNVMRTSLPEGDLHVVMAGWRFNAREWYNDSVASGELIDLGRVVESYTQGWYIPRYTAEEYEIWSVQDLLDPEVASLFQDPEEPGRGLWVNCIVGWPCRNVSRVRAAAYGLDDYYDVLEPPAAAGIDAAIAGAYERKEHVLSHYWEPTALLGMYDMVRLDEPQWTQECWDEITAAAAAEPLGTVELACGYQQHDLHILVWSGLLDTAPEVVAMLSKMFVGTANASLLEAHMQLNDATPAETAVHYLQTYEHQWTEWVSPEAAEMVRAALP